jgi:hypothetical protein
MTERELAVALDTLVDPCHGAAGDWSDVLARSGLSDAFGGARDRSASRERRSRTRRGLVLALTAGALAALVFLATGFGRDALVSLLGRIDVRFGTSKPAPAIVRREFADLSFGLPPRNAPGAIVDQTRAVTGFRIDGRERTLWVAPTRRGGFCWMFEDASGGCLDRRELVRPAVSVTFVSASSRSSIPARIEGVVTSARAHRLVAEFRDGTTMDIPFVFVSKPIGAGFFLWSVPRELQHRQTALRRVTARDGSGTVVASTTLPSLTRRPRVHVRPAPVPTSIPPAAGPVGRALPSPTPPLQHGTGDGVSVTVGRNGVVVFEAESIDPSRRDVLEGSVGVGCFTIEHDQLGIWPRELLIWRRYGPRIKVRLFGVRHPYDGCEIQAGYGHRWPDRLGSHSAVEIPLTATGRTYFADRAAARDLSQFMRANNGTKLRRETGMTLARDLRRIGGDRLVELVSPADSAPIRKIGYVTAGTTVTYVERSPSGKRFFVRLDRGRVKSQNLKPYAFSY